MYLSLRLKVFLGIGQMLCEECSHFLEIANVIRSLDLIILRGITETQGEKTLICFVTEVIYPILERDSKANQSSFLGFCLNFGLV